MIDLAKYRNGCYIPSFMESEIQKTMDEIGERNKGSRSKAMRIIVRRSQIGKDFEAVAYRMSSLPLFFRGGKK